MNEEVLISGYTEKMCSCLRSSSVIDTKIIKREDIRDEATISFSISTQIKDITVRIVHAGGKIEMYQNAIAASKLIQKYPGMCIARPEVFKRPFESILSVDDILFPGNKYFIIRSTTVEKLKRRYSRKGKISEASHGDEPKLLISESEDLGDYSDESICSAKDFFVSKTSWSKCTSKERGKEKKKFVPPIRKPKIFKELEWEPGLNSIQELSPSISE